MSIKVERQLHDMRILGRIVGAVCQWHTFSTDRSEDTKYGTIRKASFDPNIITPNEFLFCKAEK